MTETINKLLNSPVVEDNIIGVRLLKASCSNWWEWFEYWNKSGFRGSDKYYVMNPYRRTSAGPHYPDWFKYDDEIQDVPFKNEKL